MKNFDNWNREKQNLEQRESRRIQCSHREVWLCKVGVNIGNEAGKNSPFLRPVIILNEYLGGDLVLVLPLTTQKKDNLAQFQYEMNESFLNKQSFASLNQVKVISKKRLMYKLGVVPESHFNPLLEEIQKILFKNKRP